jgi:thiamine pyrophosphate-dependent acetolactate synthase large subunit-like protein
MLAGKLRRSAWTDQEIGTARRDLAGAPDPLESKIAPVVYEFLNQMLDQGQVVVLDSGQHQISARRHLRVSHPRSLLFPSDFQSMGFAIPTGIGAALASPGQTVNVVVGDGGFAMTGLELLAAAREGLHLNVFVFVDGYLGQIRRQQLENHGADYAVTLQNPDFAALAGAMGLNYHRVGDDGRDLGTAGGVTLIEVPVAGSSGLGWSAARARVKDAARRAAPAGLLRLWARFRGWKQAD